MKHKNPSTSILMFLILPLVLFSASVHARSTTLTEPAMVTTQCDLSTDDMTQAIVTGGALRGWGQLKKMPGTVELQYIKGDNKHVLTVDVRYTKNTFAVIYKDSVNLNYKVKKNGTRVIHPRPIGWMTNLSMDIETRTSAFCAN